KAEIGRLSGCVALRVVDPDRFAGGRIDGGDLAKRGADVQNTADHDRRSFVAKRIKLRVLLEDFEIRRVPTPRHFKLLDVLPIDLIERRVLSAALIAAVESPFGFCYTVFSSRGHCSQAE